MLWHFSLSLTHEHILNTSHHHCSLIRAVTYCYNGRDGNNICKSITLLPSLCILLVLKSPRFFLSVMCIPPSSNSVFYILPSKYPSSIFIPHFTFFFYWVFPPPQSCGSIFDFAYHWYGVLKPKNNTLSQFTRYNCRTSYFIKAMKHLKKHYLGWVLQFMSSAFLNSLQNTLDITRWINSDLNWIWWKPKYFARAFPLYHNIKPVLIMSQNWR